ncbi:methyl-accepting chemotaxis protein [Desulfopila aestuarii]|nr:methyl-accepting chemotaxis protein [Desulfopila aestuarii]
MVTTKGKRAINNMKEMKNLQGQHLIDIHEITACAKDLNALGPDTEPEFLTIGKTLNTLATICFGMTDNALKLSALANFSTGDTTSENASILEANTQLFDAVANHVKSTINSLGEGDSLLAELFVQVKKLRDPIGRLQSIGKTFRVLGIAIKVESSRTPEGMQGFILLADEVADIAGLVLDNCRYCIDKANLVENGISNSRQVLDSTDVSYDDSGERAINNILQSLDDIGRRSDQLASGIQERSSAMVQGIGDVVMAMQFHDITRQQLENVSSALTEVSGKAESIHAMETAEESEQAALEIYSILSIQAAHLNSIYEQVIHARKQIATGLKKSMEQAQIQAKDARTLLEMEGRTGNSSIVADLESEIDNVSLSLNKSLQVVKQAAEVSRNVYDNVVEIGSFVNKIEEIASDVKVLAINAMVEAIKTSVGGETLAVLAKELSNLSQETRDGATESIEMLQSIMAGTEKQLEFANTLNQNSVTVDEMIDGAKKFTGEILSSLQEVTTIGQQMDSASRDLSNRIMKLVPGIKFPQILGDRIDRNWQTVCRTIDQIEDAYPRFKDRSSEVKEMVEKLAQQYVMDRERSIHAQVAGQGSTDTDSSDVDLFEDDGFELFDADTPEEKKNSGGKAKEEDFGDNVELF